MTAAEAVIASLRRRDFAPLKRSLARMPAADLARLWPDLAAMEKLAIFKLLDGRRAEELFARLRFDEQYFLLGGFELGAIAPLLSDLPAEERALFSVFPRSLCDRMIALMQDGRAVLSPT